MAGADRIVLTQQLAVMDLMALGRFVLQRDDELNLAALLRSPLLGLSEDDLFREHLYHMVHPQRTAKIIDAFITKTEGKGVAGVSSSANKSAVNPLNN